jgi:DNA-binding response OmpR family regulator
VRERRNFRVLLVDDDDQVRGTLTDVLETAGHTVTAAAAGAAAVDAFAPGRFDVVVTNLGMAGMNGWEVTERLRAIDSTVVVFLITGWGLRDEEYARLTTLRVHQCLFKPVRPAELDAAIQSAFVTG